MAIYKNILLAIDFHEGIEKAIEKAAAIAQTQDATLHAIHVVEPVSYAYGAGMLEGYVTNIGQLEKKLISDSEAKLNTFMENSGCSNTKTHVILGHADPAIRKLADELEDVLIVVGSHGKKGLQLLLGSTTTGLLHGSKCDVLSIRI